VKTIADKYIYMLLIITISNIDKLFIAVKVDDLE